MCLAMLSLLAVRAATHAAQPKESDSDVIYDEESGDFVWEMDYYGKIISQRAKFLTADTLAMMKISGQKVMVSLYHKGENDN